ncbi:MAG: trimethylamine methyltransferase family protein, partial [Rhodoferax sp.]|nr:trimethylamine methyltransferase family protein [Rhodoferax sp.]
VTDESLSLETIRQVCLEGPGHYLGSAQTLQLMQKDYLYPQMADRSSPNQWTEQGRLSIIDRAANKLQSIMQSHYPTHIPQHIDDAIRAQFPVRLPREYMRPAG